KRARALARGTMDINGLGQVRNLFTEAVNKLRRQRLWRNGEVQIVHAQPSHCIAFLFRVQRLILLVVGPKIDHGTKPLISELSECLGIGMSPTYGAVVVDPDVVVHCSLLPRGFWSHALRGQLCTV